MNYAAPLAYAAQQFMPDPYAPAGHHQRPARQRRRRIRAMLLPSGMRSRHRGIGTPTALAGSR